MKRIVKPNTVIPTPQAPEAPPSSGAVFDVEALLDKGGEILRREISNLLSESSRGKLNAASARDLVAYVKLLSELKQQQALAVENMTDEEIKEKLNGNSTN